MLRVSNPLMVSPPSFYTITNIYTAHSLVFAIQDTSIFVFLFFFEKGKMDALKCILIKTDLYFAKLDTFICQTSCVHTDDSHTNNSKASVTAASTWRLILMQGWCSLFYM